VLVHRCAEDGCLQHSAVMSKFAYPSLADAWVCASLFHSLFWALSHIYAILALVNSVCVAVRTILSTLTLCLLTCMH
jgi:hypothetical protein